MINGKDEMSGYQYPGTDELEATRCLDNYNRHICSLFSKYAPQGELLDFGAGIGVLASLMSARHRVRCLEPDLSMANHLRSLGYTVYVDPNQIESKSISYVYSSNVLEHIEDDESALREIYRVLEPGGRLAIYLPAFQFLWTEMDSHVGHYRRYSRSSILNKTKRTGFRTIDSFYVDSIGFFATLFYKGQKVYRPPQLRALRVFDKAVFPASKVLDRLTRRTFGKNLFVIAERPA